MPRLSEPLREQAIHMLNEGGLIKEVLNHLERGGVTVCRRTIWRLWKHYKQNNQISPFARSGRPRILTPRKLVAIEECMQRSDETTGKELVVRVYEATGKKLSLRSVYKGRKELGWSYRGAAYCQLIREVNKQKWLEWARQVIDDTFADVIWTDETSVQLETHRRFCCRKNGQRPRNKPHPKHPVKVHVWGGITWNGATNVCIFDGIMDAERYINILDQTLVPFISQVYPHRHRFMQDNDPSAPHDVQLLSLRKRVSTGGRHHRRAQMPTQ